MTIMIFMFADVCIFSFFLPPFCSLRDNNIGTGTCNLTFTNGRELKCSGISVEFIVICVPELIQKNKLTEVKWVLHTNVLCHPTSSTTFARPIIPWRTVVLLLSTKAYDNNRFSCLLTYAFSPPFLAVFEATSSAQKQERRLPRPWQPTAPCRPSSTFVLWWKHRFYYCHARLLTIMNFMFANLCIFSPVSAVFAPTTSVTTQGRRLPRPWQSTTACRPSSTFVLWWSVIKFLLLSTKAYDNNDFHVCWRMHFLPCFCSLAYNKLGDDAGKEIAKALTINTTVQKIKYVRSLMKTSFIIVMQGYWQ